MLGFSFCPPVPANSLQSQPVLEWCPYIWIQLMNDRIYCKHCPALIYKWPIIHFCVLKRKCKSKVQSSTNNLFYRAASLRAGPLLCKWWDFKSFFICMHTVLILGCILSSHPEQHTTTTLLFFQHHPFSTKSSLIRSIQRLHIPYSKMNGTLLNMVETAKAETVNARVLFFFSSLYM